MKMRLGSVLLMVLTLAVSPWLRAADEAERNYTLDAGDVIRIHVFGEDDLTLETALGQTGQINYPYLGTIAAAGMTVQQLERAVTDGLRGDYLVNPSVNVSIVTYRPFYIYGEVKSPGGYPYQPNLTIERAVALAGGFTQRASRNKVKVNRNVGGKESSVEAEMNGKVRPGDTILVKDSFF